MEEKVAADSLASIAKQAVELAKRLGADQAEAGVSYDEGLSVTVRMGELESVERQRDRGLAVTVYCNARKGSASTTDFDAASVEEIVRKALSIGSFTTADEYAGLADAALMAVDPPDLDLYFPWDLDVEHATELAKGWFGHLVAAIRGTAQYRRASFLVGAAGKQVLPSFVDITEDPLIPRALASAPFDGEGVATKRRELVTAGVLQGYVLSSYSARRLGLPTTGNAGGVHNLLVRPTAGPLAELIEGCEEGFVVGELLGHGVNVVTGDYSRGAAGFWVERGEIVHPVHEVTIAGTLQELYRNIRAIGSDVDSRGTVRCGSVLVDGLTLAGQ